MINPKIVSESVKQAYIAYGEGCLSVDKEHNGYVYRPYKVKVQAYDLLKEKNVEYVFTGFGSMCVQHEIDHLKGILFYDHIDKKDPFKEDPDAIKIPVPIQQSDIENFNEENIDSDEEFVELKGYKNE